MRSFIDEFGQSWIAEAREQKVARHHGRWYLVFRHADTNFSLPMPEVRWQTQSSADRILGTMSEAELRKRLDSVRARFASNDGPSEFEGEWRATIAKQRLAAG